MKVNMKIEIEIKGQKIVLSEEEARGLLQALESAFSPPQPIPVPLPVPQPSPYTPKPWEPIITYSPSSAFP